MLLDQIKDKLKPSGTIGNIYMIYSIITIWSILSMYHSYDYHIVIIIISVYSPRHICDKDLINKTENARTVSTKHI